MTSSTPPDSTRFLACPLCGSLVDPEKGVKDQRWANLVHAECVKAIATWPSYARDPRGRAGSDEYYDR